MPRSIIRSPSLHRQRDRPTWCMCNSQPRRTQMLRKPLFVEMISRYLHDFARRRPSSRNSQALYDAEACFGSCWEFFRRSDGTTTLLQVAFRQSPPADCRCCSRRLYLARCRPSLLSSSTMALVALLSFMLTICTLFPLVFLPLITSCDVQVRSDITCRNGTWKPRRISSRLVVPLGLLLRSMCLISFGSPWSIFGALDLLCVLMG